MGSEGGSHHPLCRGHLWRQQQNTKTAPTDLVYQHYSFKNTLTPIICSDILLWAALFFPMGNKCLDIKTLSYLLSKNTKKCRHFGYSLSQPKFLFSSRPKKKILISSLWTWQKKASLAGGERVNTPVYSPKSGFSQVMGKKLGCLLLWFWHCQSFLPWGRKWAGASTGRLCVSIPLRHG